LFEFDLNSVYPFRIACCKRKLGRVMHVAKNLGSKILVKIKSFAPIATAIALFLLFKLFYLAPRFSDGHVYTYMGHLIAQGAIPYRDFYYSSPPFLPYAMAAFGTLTNWHGPSFDALPNFLSALDALLIYLIGYKKTGRFPALIAAVMYLGAYSTLATSDFASDIHWIVSLSLLGWWAHTENKFRLSRFLFAMTVLVKAYAVVIVVAVGALLWLVGQRKNAVFLVGTVAVVGFLVCEAFYLWVGPQVLDQIYFNNLHRTPGLSTASILDFFSNHDLWIYPVSGALAFLLWKNPRSWPFAVPLALYLGFFLLYSDVYYLYLKPLSAYACLLIGTGAVQGARTRKIFYPVFASLGIVTTILSLKTYIKEQSEASTIDGLTDIVKLVSELTAPGEAIYGESTFTPIVALLADRPIFKNYVDTNIKFFNQGLFTLEGRAREISDGEVKVILTKGVVVQNQIQSLSSVLPLEFLASHCQVARSFPLKMDYSENAVLVWRCVYPK
jgi:hypothetical protein